MFSLQHGQVFNFLNLHCLKTSSLTVLLFVLELSASNVSRLAME
jgi:hypothetical protein